MFGDVRALGDRDQRFGFLLTHLAAAHHVVNQVTGAFDGECAQSSGRANNFTHGARHLATGFEADFVGTGCHFGRRITSISRPVARTAPGRGRASGCFGVGLRVVGLRRIGHKSSKLLQSDRMR